MYSSWLVYTFKLDLNKKLNLILNLILILFMEIVMTLTQEVQEMKWQLMFERKKLKYFLIVELKSLCLSYDVCKVQSCPGKIFRKSAEKIGMRLNWGMRHKKEIYGICDLKFSLTVDFVLTMPTCIYVWWRKMYHQLLNCQPTHLPSFLLFFLFWGELEIFQNRSHVDNLHVSLTKIDPWIGWYKLSNVTCPFFSLFFFDKNGQHGKNIHLKKARHSRMTTWTFERSWNEINIIWIFWCED